MVDQQVTITKSPTLDESTVQKFKASLRGEQEQHRAIVDAILKKIHPTAISK